LSVSAGTGRNLFVTGATGVVGRRAIPRLVAEGHRVTAVGRSAEKRGRLASAGARPVAVDLFDGPAVRRALSEAEAEVVINLATHMPSSAFRMMLPWSWRENDRVRREASAALVDAALEAGVRGFVQESFAPIYEAGGEAWIDETWPVRPAPYNRTVLDAERSVERFAEGGGRGVVLRFAGFYGPDPFLATMVATMKRGWAPLPGPQDAYWSSLAQDDAATAVVAALEAPPGIYNVCDDEPLTRREYGEVLALTAGARPPRPIPGWLAKLGGSTMELLSRSQRMSNGKLKSATGWSPRWPSARQGIPAAVEELRGASPLASRGGQGGG
jgi:nucleoside-diphosphate-sugar epimerase